MLKRYTSRRHIIKIYFKAVGIERQMFAITEEHYNEGNLKSNTTQMCIKIDALIYHYAGMAGDMAFLAP